MASWLPNSKFAHRMHGARIDARENCAMLRTIMKTFSLATFAALAFAVCGCNAEDKAKPVNDTQPKDLSKLSKEELAKHLDKDAYNVCIMGGTERPFENKYWNNHELGVYVDIISGKPLFASTHKFESGSGWPSFFQPIDKKEI